LRRQAGLLGALSAIRVGRVWRARQTKLITTLSAPHVGDPHGCSQSRPNTSSWRIPGATGRRSICVTTVRSTSSPLRRPAQAKAWVCPSRRFSPGAASAVIHDIKGENWELTAGWRRSLLELSSLQPDRCPLGRLQPADGGASRRPGGARRAEHCGHPGRSGRRARAAAIIGRRRVTRCSWERFCMCSMRKPTKLSPALPTSSPIRRQPFEVTLRAMMLGTPPGHNPTSVVASAAREVLNKSENERSGVFVPRHELFGSLPGPDSGDRDAAL